MKTITNEEKYYSVLRYFDDHFEGIVADNLTKNE
jgi:hypothetical protein